MASKLARQKATINLMHKLLPDAKFTELPSESLICLLCTKILRNPIQLSCGHRVCKPCEETWKASGDGKMYCPNDEELIERSFPDMAALTEIMHLCCFCISRDDGCEWQGLILQLEDHINECQYSVQSECPFHDFHCTFMGNRTNIEKHLVDDCTKHDTLIATSLLEVLNSCEENRERFSDIKEKTIDIEKAFEETNNEMIVLQTMLNKTSDMIDGKCIKISQVIKEDMRRFEDIITSSEKKKSKFVAFHNKFKELMTKVETQMLHVNESQNKSVENKSKSFVHTKTKLVDKLKRLNESNKTHEKQLNELGIKIRIFQCSSYNGRYVWKLDNLRNRFTEALSGKVDELYTPPIYTSLFGYKFSAKVMLYGTADKVNVKHLSFYIVIMRGDYDDLLTFPFPYPIIITLLNTNNKPDITHTLYPDPDKLHFQRPYKVMNHAIGFSRFCSHDRLYSDGFVKNDAIYFNISVDKTAVNIKEPNI